MRELPIQFSNLCGKARAFDGGLLLLATRRQNLPRVFDAMLLFGKRARFAGGGELRALQFDVGLREPLFVLGLRELGGFVLGDE